MNTWLTRALNLIRIDGQHSKSYEAFNSNHNQVSSAHQVGHESAAYWFARLFDLLSTNNVSLDEIDETLKATRLRLARNDCKNLEGKPEKCRV